MRPGFRIAAVLTLAASLPVTACREAPDTDATAPSPPGSTIPVADRVQGATSPRGRAVLAAMEEYKQAILESDTATLARIWAESYSFINPQGALVSRAERLANIGSGSTDVQVIDNEREITVRLFGDAAIVQNLSTLHGTFSGQPTDTDLRGTFVWIHRAGRWQLVTNQLTALGN